MPEDRKKLTISMPSDAHDLATRAAGPRPADYLADLVRDAYREWTEAAVYLQKAGWRREEVCAACDALNGCWLTGRPRGAHLALEIHDHARLEGAVAKWGLDGDVWRKRVAELQADDDLAWHLWLLAREFWRRSREVEALLERMPSVRD